MIHNIRPEMSQDIDPIRIIHSLAFANHPFSQQTEHLIIAELRRKNALTLSLVAEFSGKAVGHIAFSPVFINGKDLGWHGLGPVGVLPEFQGKKIGSDLIRGGLRSLKSSGSRGVVVLGDPGYYTKFGFSAHDALTYPGPPADHFMCQMFSGHMPIGIVTYHPAFDITS